MPTLYYNIIVAMKISKDILSSTAAYWAVDYDNIRAVLLAKLHLVSEHCKAHIL